MTYELGNDKHLITLNAIAQYAKPVQQKNVTTVNIDYAIRKTKLMLVLLPQWAAEFPPFNLCRLSAVVKQAGYESCVLDANIKAYRYYKNNFENNKKVIQYFGGDYCPFSNVNSNAYKIIKDFENEYGDRITVSYYWAGKDNEIMQTLDVKYVPTILNSYNESIELKLPEDVDTTGLSNDELRTMLLENIYNNL
jgi:hypothetical protein